ncbi:uncharacterized protein LOC110463762 isoform X2 [Mizuhopecten yessoensis]|uniref:uncharacterized protein LOC110463762 isoform X2 n=1 Tax=Mizuhopecten yessoensis TaxID=6573 RepID=UPI000B459743|nr:uncharacterized protein LOC110463762 isoform X2 [Mizuhopecten yessoensis]
MAKYPDEDIPALVNGIGTPITQSTTNTEVRDIPIPSSINSNNIPPPSKATLTTNTTDATNGTTPLPVSNSTDAPNNGTTHSPESDTANVTNMVTSPPVSDVTNVTNGSIPIPASNPTDVVTGATPSSTSGNSLPPVASTSVSSVDVITIESSPVRIKTEVIDEEFNTNAVGKNLMENIDWFLDQVEDGYKECDVHKMDMLEQNLVCLTCQKFMCALCLRDFHGGHDIISISKLRECRNVRNILEDDVSALQLMQQAFKTEFDDKQELKKQIEQSAETLLKNVDTAFNQLLIIVESKRKEIKKHICDFEKQNVTELCKDLERIKAIEQSATLMIRRVMVFFTKFDISEARILPNTLSEMISKCREFRVDRRQADHKEKFLPEKKFSNILPSLLAVTNICKTIHPEATKVVWSKITPDRRNGDSDTPSKHVCEDTKDPSVLLAHLASTPENTRSPSPFDTDTTEEMEVTIPKPKKSAAGSKRNSDVQSIVRTSVKDMCSKNHPLQKKTRDFDDCWYRDHKKKHKVWKFKMICADPTGRGKSSQKTAEKRKEKDRSVSPGTVRSPTKPSKKARVSTEPSATSPSTSLANSSTDSAFSSSSTSSVPGVSSSMSSLPVITSVVSLAEGNRSMTRKTFNSNNSLSGLFDIDFNSAGTSQESTKNSKDRKQTMDKKKVMAVVPSVNKSLNNVVKHPGRRPGAQSRLSSSSSSSLESITAAPVSAVVTSAPNTRTDTSGSQTVASTSNSRLTGTTTSGSTFTNTSPGTYSRTITLHPERSRSPTPSPSQGSSSRETGAAATPATPAASVADREPSEDSEEVPMGQDGLPILSLVTFYPQTMTQGRTVMVRALQGKIWLGYVSNINALKASCYFSVQWLTGQFGVDTKFEIQEKWQRKSDKVHTDCIICHFDYTMKQVMSDELLQQLKIASKQPPCSVKPRSTPPKPSTASPGRIPTRTDNRTHSASPQLSRDNSTGSAAMTTRRGTPSNKSNPKPNTKS